MVGKEAETGYTPALNGVSCPREGGCLGGPMTCRELLDDLYVPLRGISERTQNLYHMTLASYGRHLGCEPTVEEHLSEIPVARYLSDRMRTRSAATAAKDRSQIRALWEFAARRGLTDQFPLLRPIRVPERIPEAWTADEVRRLIEAAGDHEGVFAGVPAGLFFQALIRVLFDTGERISAVMALRWADVGDGLVTFRAETRKMQTRDVIRGISPPTAAALEKIRRPRPLVFVWDRCESNLWRHIGLVNKRAGLPRDRKSKFHRLRKTCASYAAAAGLDPQRLLDHSSPATTRAYLDPRIVTQRQACDVLPGVG